MLLGLLWALSVIGFDPWMNFCIWFEFIYDFLMN